MRVPIDQVAAFTAHDMRARSSVYTYIAASLAAMMPGEPPFALSLASSLVTAMPPVYLL
jgi:hypothetical protein